MISKVSGLAAESASEERYNACFVESRSRPSSSKPSIFTLWHLVSLDAPTVAVLWTVFLATITHTKLPIATPIAMALSVWMLYASDRLLDTKHIGGDQERRTVGDLELRHLFHHRYRTAFTRVLIVCLAALAMLLPLLPSAALHLYLVEGAALAGYFLLIHVAPSSAGSRGALLLSTYRLPKELLVGPFFSAATFIPIVSRRPELRSDLLPLAILFAALCSLNCFYIHAWEHPRGDGSDWTSTYFTGNLSVLSSLFLAASLLCFLSSASTARISFNLRPYALACAGSGLLLVAIHSLRRRFSPVALRTAADAALLTPLLILPFLVHSHR